MKQKITILARLLKEGQITVDEFIALSEVEIRYVYTQSYQQTYPYTITTSPGNWTSGVYAQGTNNNNSCSSETTLASSIAKTCSCELVNCSCNKN